MNITPTSSLFRQMGDFQMGKSLWSLTPCFLALAVCISCVGCDDSASTATVGDTSGNGTASQQGAALTDDALRDRIDKVLDFSEMRYMSTQDHGAWQILHGVLAFGRELRIRHEGELIRAMDHVKSGGAIDGFLLLPADHGLDTIVQPGSEKGQGHDDQWLAELSQGGMQLDDTIRWGDKDYTMQDLVTQTQWDLPNNQELSWTLMGLSAYLPIDAKWQANDNTEWDFARLVNAEATADRSETCGGTHQLVGLAMAINKYLDANPEAELAGPWKIADDKIQNAIRLAREYQQADGAFSVDYFRRPATNPDEQARIDTTGHTLEFLCFAMSEQQLSEQWVAAAANHLCELLETTREQSVEPGGLYHAVHALQIYRYRRFGERVFEQGGGLWP